MSAGRAPVRWASAQVSPAPPSPKVTRNHLIEGQVSHPAQPSVASHLRHLVANATKADVAEELALALSISLVVLLLILVAVFLHNGGLKFSHALTCLLLGFFLAGTSMAPTIQQGLAATANLVAGIRP